MTLSERIEEAQDSAEVAETHEDMADAFSHLADLLESQVGKLNARVSGLEKMLEYLRDEVTEQEFGDLKNNTTPFLEGLLAAMSEKEPPDEG